MPLLCGARARRRGLVPHRLFRGVGTQEGPEALPVGNAAVLRPLVERDGVDVYPRPVRWQWAGTEHRSHGLGSLAQHGAGVFECAEQYLGAITSSWIRELGSAPATLAGAYQFSGSNS